MKLSKKPLSITQVLSCRHKAMCRDAEYLEYLKRSVDFRIKRETGC